MSTSIERLALSKQASDARLRASIDRLEGVARARLHRSRATMTRTVSSTGHELIRDLVSAEVVVLIALAFGVGVLLGRR